jgi:hypothetical protein
VWLRFQELLLLAHFQSSSFVLPEFIGYTAVKRTKDSLMAFTINIEMKFQLLGILIRYEMSAVTAMLSMAD